MGWRIGPVEVGGQRWAGGEQQGEETGLEQGATGGHGGLDVIGRAGIAAIITGGCAGLPERPRCRDVGVRSAGYFCIALTSHCAYSALAFT